MTSSMKKFMKKSSKPFQVIKGSEPDVPFLKKEPKKDNCSEKMTILQSILARTTRGWWPLGVLSYFSKFSSRALKRTWKLLFFFLFSFELQQQPSSLNVTSESKQRISRLPNSALGRCQRTFFWELYCTWHKDDSTVVIWRFKMTLQSCSRDSWEE